MLAVAGSLLFVLPTLQAADITGKVILKGTAPKEKDIPQVKDDPNCGKLHTGPVTTHHYVVGANGGDFAVVPEVTTGGSCGSVRT